MGKTNKYKFEFGTDFQELILQYTVNDAKGYKVLELYEDSYFTLIHHAVIAYGLKKYYKKHKHVPGEVYLREFLRTLYNMDKVIKLNLQDTDINLIDTTIIKLYNEPLKHSEMIVEKCVNFAKYVSFKNELERVDIENYDSYEASIDKFRKAINIGVDLEENNGTFLVAGMKDRAHKRDTIHVVTPTPYWQMNHLLNSGGTERGNVITILAKEKFFKTGMLINTAKGYLKMRKKGFYADLENGELAIVTRSEQSIANVEQDVIQSGEWDNRLLKLFRKYNRVGAELAIKRFPNLKTTTDHLQLWLDKLRQDYGFIPNFGIIDYGLLMGSTTGKEDEFNRISDAHLDMKNFSDKNNLDALWSAAHITRDGNKRVGTKFQSTDIAKCIDIPKHIDALLGLQQNEEEAAAGVMRMEVIEQRNGMKDGKMLFWVDIARQTAREFTRAEVKEYLKQTQDSKPEEKSYKRNKKSDL